jgi:hypothetical protein
VLTCHCIVGVGLPVAEELKQTCEPAQTVESLGWRFTTGGVWMIRTAEQVVCWGAGKSDASVTVTETFVEALMFV